MQNMRGFLDHFAMHHLLIHVISVVILQALGGVSVAVPSSGCYVFDNSSHIYDFSSWIGQPFEYDGVDADLVVRFCKDVETRSQKGYVAFGRYDKFNNFRSGFGSANFVQEYYNGDLTSCEISYDKLGRTAQVNIFCGDCPSGQCKGGLGCICNVNYESTCRVVVDLAIPCEKQGPRVFEGFTVGFHPRAWEIVHNGLTQIGFEKAHSEFSFGTEQTRISLYMTAIASSSSLVQKPTIMVYPEKGLEVKLSGTGASGSPPTTLSPTVLVLDWRCDQARDSPYEVTVTIPVKGYDPVQFTFTKMCEYKQSENGAAMEGWAIFGVLSCILVVVSSIVCCGGFIYQTRVGNLRGLDALPGVTVVSACLDILSGGAHGYSRTEEINNRFANQVSWDHQPVSAQEKRRPLDRSYGSMI
ncbi:G-protein coupled receptor [Lithospermum erythrorhizon]|uniref:G-protein coupled receptor n=1 Tax=Lithospermum erythrorhizon TaxID=34254 RepID=A0AAV3NK03_LITER